eukprot:TRINITY_DN12347_c0_g1_i1.p1 TRINITY_DN12347_c0_g1~~TRINITY_DN12347_c0_g1_i1.p1  ORF type:complete len:247 (-),score=69.61 TRINITY_DN12347_c0_g1_i1:110-850(-)
MRVGGIAEYKEETSESSFSSEDTKEGTTQKTNIGRHEPLLEAMKMIKEEASLSPCKLNSARSFSTSKFYPSAKVKAKLPLKFVINTGKLRPLHTTADYYKEIGNYEHPQINETRANQDISALINLGNNLTECRQTADYKNFANEFENEFKANQQEIDRLSQELFEEDRKLSEFMEELESADLDMVLLRNNLLREVGTIQNSLREANSNIVVLMNDRAQMKDQFCFLQMKMKKLKACSRTFQEDLQA